MAEGRMLKKRISKSKKFAQVDSDSARLLYLMLLPHLDVEGRHEACPVIVKGTVVPKIPTFTLKIIEQDLEELSKVGLILLYEYDGDKYLQFTRFEDFQSLKHDREAKSEIPAPPDSLTQEQLLSESGETQEQVTGNSALSLSLSLREVYSRLFDFWNAQGIIVHKNMNGSESTLKAKLKQYTEEEIAQAIVNYKKVLDSDEYFFKYRWTLKDFLNRGLERFLSSAHPLQNFKVNKPINPKDKRVNDGFDKDKFLKE